MQLVPIIDYIAEFVTKNEEAVGKAIKWGFVLGTALMLLGMFKLALDGVANALLIVFGLNITQAIAKQGGMIGVLSLLYKKLAVEVLAAGTAIGAMTTLGLISFFGMIGGIILAIAMIFKLKNAIGGWGEFFLSVLRGIMRTIVFLGEFIVESLINPIQYLLDILSKAMDALGMQSKLDEIRTYLS